MARNKDCPCGLGQPYADCCGRLHSGRTKASTAELLMRSRYSAFAVGDAEYLLRSWHSTTRPRSLELDSHDRWTRLEILGKSGGGMFEAEGTVEFRAHYTGGVVHENSRFLRENGHWVYLDAITP